MSEGCSRTSSTRWRARSVRRARCWRMSRTSPPWLRRRVCGGSGCRVCGYAAEIQKLLRRIIQGCGEVPCVHRVGLGLYGRWWWKLRKLLQVSRRSSLGGMRALRNHACMRRTQPPAPTHRTSQAANVLLHGDLPASTSPPLLRAASRKLVRHRVSVKSPPRQRQSARARSARKPPTSSSPPPLHALKAGPPCPLLHLPHSASQHSPVLFWLPRLLRALLPRLGIMSARCWL